MIFRSVNKLTELLGQVSFDGATLADDELLVPVLDLQQRKNSERRLRLVAFELWRGPRQSHVLEILFFQLEHEASALGQTATVEVGELVRRQDCESIKSIIP